MAVISASMPKCHLCGKDVYPAEKKQVDGKVFHNTCFLEFRKREQQSYKETHQSEYFKEADVRPAYYRVADKDRGLEARMVSSKDEE